jgi:hypothetical protein
LLNKSNTLFASNSPALREKRKRAIIHEFTHCIAAFLSLGRIKSKQLLNKLVNRLAARVRMNEMDHYQMLLSQIGSFSTAVSYALGIYLDEHFRRGFEYFENFEDSYSTLYKNLILDRKTFEIYFKEDMRKEFTKELKDGNIQKALTILNAACTDLISEEAISADFVNLRLREEFIAYYYF